MVLLLGGRDDGEGGVESWEDEVWVAAGRWARGSAGVGGELGLGQRLGLEQGRSWICGWC